MNRSRGMEGGWGATGRSAWMGRAPLRDCRVRGKGQGGSVLFSERVELLDGFDSDHGVQLYQIES